METSEGKKIFRKMEYTVGFVHALEDMQRTV